MVTFHIYFSDSDELVAHVSHIILLVMLQPHFVSPPRVGFIATLYILVGCGLLFESISRGAVFHFHAIIAMIVVTLVTATAGLIMASSSAARNTVNKSKLMGIFGCLLLAGISASIAVIIRKSFSGRLDKNQAFAFEFFYYYVRLALLLIAGVLVLTLTSLKNPHSPTISVVSKFVVGIAVIISCCVGFLFAFCTFGRKASYYTSISCTVLIALGTIGGIIIAILNRPPSAERSSFIVASV